MGKDLFTIKEYRNRFWQVAEVFKNEKSICEINKFYDVTPDWIIIYDTSGGSGYGYSKGDIIRKIFIGDSEFKKEIVNYKKY